MSAALLATPAAHAAACPAPTSPAQLRAALTDAEAAWTAADEAAFRLRMEEVFLQVPCLDTVVQAPLAARLHRDAGLWLFATGNAEAAGRAFASARRVAPDTPMPDALLPPAHPARALYDAAVPDLAAEAPPPPATGTLTFDGAPGDRPTAGPTVAQLEEAGALAWTRYLRSDQPLPPYAAAEMAVAPPVAPAPVARDGKALAWTLTAGAGALAVGSGVLALVARGHQQTFLDQPPGNKADLEGLYDRNRRASTTSAVLLAGAGAAGVGAVFAW